MGKVVGRILLGGHLLQTNKLSALAVFRKTKPGRYADGGGLYLQVARGGSKQWLFRYSRDRKARQMGLGSVHTVTLAEAREAARGCRRRVLFGEDPIESRRSGRAAALLAAASAITFRQCAENYIAAHQAGWKNPKHHAQWIATLKNYAYPVVGNLAINAIDVGLVMKVLEPI